MGSFTRWLSGLFGEARAEEIESSGYRIHMEEERTLALERAAIQSAVGLVAAAVGQCHFRTFLQGEEVREDEYWLWNYSPNRNCNSTQFIQELVETLVYNNEALVIEHCGELFLADDFSYREEGMREYVFSGITVGGETLADRRSPDVLFFRLGNTDIRPLLSELCHQYEELIGKAVESYGKACADKGILSTDSVGKGDQKMEEYRKDLLENKFKKFFSAQNAVLPLNKGYTYTSHKREFRNTSEINDVKTLGDEVYNRVGQAFRIPPALLRGETAQSGDTMDRFIRLCVRPFCNMLEEEITRKRYGRKAAVEGSYLAVDTAMLEITGLLASAEKMDRIIGCGILSIDEVREKTGERALGTEEARRHYITKNYGTVDTGEGKGDSDGS